MFQCKIWIIRGSLASLFGCSYTDFKNLILFSVLPTEQCRSQFIVCCFVVQDVLFAWSDWNGVCLDSRACLRSELVKKLITFLILLPDLCLPGAHVKRVFYSNGEIPDYNLMVLDLLKCPQKVLSAIQMCWNSALRPASSSHGVNFGPFLSVSCT